MLPTRAGSLHLFRVVGINVFVHWSWFLAAVYFFQVQREEFHSPVWNIIAYLSLFGIVLLHEFGHALACRSVGGRADEIVLWPLGGVAYVAPPPRPGAVLWSIAAGPLVNVGLAIVFYIGGSRLMAVLSAFPGAGQWFNTVMTINLVLLVFNLLPIYPLDGGQILRALLWFVVGPVRSVLIAIVIGFAGALVLGTIAYFRQNPWLGLMAAFIFFRCLTTWKQVRASSQHERELP